LRSDCEVLLPIIGDESAKNDRRDGGQSQSMDGMALNFEQSQDWKSFLAGSASTVADP